MRNGRVLFVIDPLVEKSFVGDDVPCFRGGALANALDMSAPSINRFSTAATK